MIVESKISFEREDAENLQLLYRMIFPTYYELKKRESEEGMEQCVNDPGVSWKKEMQHEVTEYYRRQCQALLNQYYLNRISHSSPTNGAPIIMEISYDIDDSSIESIDRAIGYFSRKYNDTTMDIIHPAVDTLSHLKKTMMENFADFLRIQIYWLECRKREMNMMDEKKQEN